MSEKQTLSRQEKVKQILERLETGVHDIFQSENYADYLRTMKKFHHYSIQNSMLIWMQRPDAECVAGYRDWQVKFGRQVRKGEKGIQILAPVIKKMQVCDRDGHPTDREQDVVIACRPVYVFDVKQTEGPELPSIAHELLGSVDNYQALSSVLADVSPCQIAFEEILDGSHGYYSPVEDRIAIQIGMSEQQTVKTMVHEIAHATMHRLDTGVSLRRALRDAPTDRHAKEVQAESVAFTVCDALGLDTSDYSFGYVAGWSSDRNAKELAASMEVIRQTSMDLISQIENRMAQVSGAKLS